MCPRNPGCRRPWRWHGPVPNFLHLTPYPGLCIWAEMRQFPSLHRPHREATVLWSDRVNDLAMLRLHQTEHLSVPLTAQYLNVLMTADVVPHCRAVPAEIPVVFGLVTLTFRSAVSARARWHTRR